MTLACPFSNGIHGAEGKAATAALSPDTLLYTTPPSVAIMAVAARATREPDYEVLVLFDFIMDVGR